MLWVACARKLKKTREKKIRVAKFDNSDNGTPEGTRHTMVPASSSRRRANVHRTFAFYCSSPKYKNNPNPSPTEIRFGLSCLGTPEGTRCTMVSAPSSRRANVRRTFAFYRSSPPQKSKTGHPEWDNPFLVRRKGLEPPTLGTGIRCSIH